MSDGRHDEIGGDAGTVLAREQDIRLANARLVVGVARTYQGRGLALEELVDEGNAGLTRAAQQFDWRVRGATFVRTQHRGSVSRSSTRSTVAAPDQFPDPGVRERPGVRVRPCASASISRSTDASRAWKRSRARRGTRKSSASPTCGSAITSCIPAEQSYPSPYLLDPIVTLAWAAAVTENIGLGTSVLVLPQHNPLELANMLATIDSLSGGRLTHRGRRRLVGTRVRRARLRLR